ncbi:hypothetical protein [Cellulomonas endophytica]|uniref:hypothetical protein n=1 Tax=Cellulomonas endophytica TaxID=2494735 RepID=UPI001013760B|nr:hypothetical protein [Cellulomonas endophytica]
MPVPALPRSVLLAAWLAVPSDPARLVPTVQGDDEPHAVEGPDGSAADLRTFVADVAADLHDVGCLLPVPGEPPPLPPALSAAATAAGECVLLRTGGGCLAAVPDVRRFGSALEPGHLVTWTVERVPDWRRDLLARQATLEEADRALRLGLATATDALTRLDVARWRPGLQDDLAALRDDRALTTALPPGTEGARVRLLVSAARLRAVVALARVDDGAAVTGGQVDRRRDALDEVDASARRALAAAVTSDLGPLDDLPR